MPSSLFSLIILRYISSLILYDFYLIKKIFETIYVSVDASAVDSTSKRKLCLPVHFDPVAIRWLDLPTRLFGSSFNY